VYEPKYAKNQFCSNRKTLPFGRGYRPWKISFVNERAKKTKGLKMKGLKNQFLVPQMKGPNPRAPEAVEIAYD